MRRFIFTILVCGGALLMGASRSLAESKIIGGRGPNPDNRERILLFTPRGPLVVDLIITVEGRPYRERSEKLVQEILKQADTNGDGKPTWKEAVANPKFIVDFSRLRKRSNLKEADRLRYLKYSMKRYDKNGNNTMEKSEALGVITQLIGGKVLTFNLSYSASATVDIKKLLDTDSNHILSKAELEQMGERLSGRDANENDLIERSEVSATSTRRTYNSQKSNVIFYLDKTVIANNLHQLLLDRYSNNADYLLQKSMPLLAELWSQLDVDKNGSIDKQEIKQFHTTSPHIAFNISFDIQKSRLQIQSITKEMKALKNKTTATTFQLGLPALQFVVAVSNGTTSAITFNYKQYAQKTLQQFDSNKNGYIERKEIKDNPRFDTTPNNRLNKFARWDTDADGKVYAEEIEAPYRKSQEIGKCRITVSLNHLKEMLFELIDETGDNRISLRELQTAKTRLLTLDKNNDGKLTPNELPERISLTFKQGRSTTRNRYGITPQTNKQQGPKWFVHMDKNNDGDISPREFLGKPEMFQQLDRNHDGFVEKKEAEAATPMK